MKVLATIKMLSIRRKCKLFWNGDTLGCDPGAYGAPVWNIRSNVSSEARALEIIRELYSDPEWDLEIVAPIPENKPGTITIEINGVLVTGSRDEIRSLLRIKDI